MKSQTALFAAVLLVGCSQQPSSVQPAKSMSAENMEMADANHMQMPPDAAAIVIKATAVGTITELDVTASTITISHGPVDALKWPAMIMTFKATPGQLTSVKAGQKVNFDFVAKGMDATLIRIAPLN